MKAALMSATMAATLGIATVPAPAVALPVGFPGEVTSPGQVVLVDSLERPGIRGGHRRRQGDMGHLRGQIDSAPRGHNGGYKVNRYGFGNYVGGPGGGFAGYPAGSAGAQVYKQRQEWKCEAVPERC